MDERIFRLREALVANPAYNLFYNIRFKSFSPIAPPYLNKNTYFERIEEYRKYMQDLAQVSGGRSFQVDDIADFEATFDQVATELGQQYSLGYYPKQATEGRKQIKVKVKRPNLAVRARSRYIIEQKK